MCTVLILVNDQDSTWMAQVSGLRKHLLPSQPKAQLTHSSSRTGLTTSSMLSFTTSFHQLPAGRPSCSSHLSLFVLFMVQCSLHQLPARRPNCKIFHFLGCSWCFRVADYSWPVAMADCCWCPSPCSHAKIVQQSTGLLKPLIECIVCTQ